MLFIVNKQGVPSVAPIVQLPLTPPDVTKPTQPGTPTATGGYGAISVAWSASTDNVAVTGYTIYRSTTPNFIP